MLSEADGRHLEFLSRGLYRHFGQNFECLKGLLLFSL